MIHQSASVSVAFHTVEACDSNSDLDTQVKMFAQLLCCSCWDASQARHWWCFPSKRLKGKTTLDSCPWTLKKWCRRWHWSFFPLFHELACKCRKWHVVLQAKCGHREEGEMSWWLQLVQCKMHPRNTWETLPKSGQGCFWWKLGKRKWWCTVTWVGTRTYKCRSWRGGGQVKSCVIGGTTGIYLMDFQRGKYYWTWDMYFTINVWLWDCNSGLLELYQATHSKEPSQYAGL